MKYPDFDFESFSARKRGVSHGGDFSLGRRKTARPIDPKQAIQIVLSSSQAHGRWSLLFPAHRRHLTQLVQKTARRWRIRLFFSQNRGNQLILVVKVQSKVQFQRFLKELTGGIAQIVTGARKGVSLAKRFWDHLAFTKILPLRAFTRWVARFSANVQTEPLGPVSLSPILNL